MRHGQGQRAIAVCEALVDDNPRDGVASVALAELLLNNGDARRAVDVLRVADVPKDLDHAEAVLETRALRMLGRNGDAKDRWNRHLESRKGSERRWV